MNASNNPTTLNHNARRTHRHALGRRRCPGGCKYLYWKGWPGGGNGGKSFGGRTKAGSWRCGGGWYVMLASFHAIAPL
jgi:hypothetical protein